MSSTIYKDGKPSVSIFISPEASEQEKYAASELRYYLGRMTAGVYEIVTEIPGKNNCIAIGKSASVFGESYDKELGADGFEIKAANGVITVNGGVRGCIYGTYELLEKLGCRFFTSKCEYIPTFTQLEIPDICERQIPKLEFRSHNCWDVNQNSRFAVKMRLNGSFPAIKEKHGGHMPYAMFVHTFGHLCPVSEYGETHPEYFSLVNGERSLNPVNTQLCLTNPDVLKIVIDNTRKVLKANPKAMIMSISQNDCYNNCQCEKCRAADAAEGSPSGTLLTFVNAVAEALEPEFPDVIFDTLAYNYSRPAPKTVRPRRNVCVRLCSIECCFSHPMESCDDESRSVVKPDGTRSGFVTDLRAWGKVSDRNYIWDYTTCFAHYAAPHPNWRALQPNLKLFIENGVKGVFEQANPQPGVDLNELRCYVISKLLWNAEADVPAIIREFTDYYYGAAAPFVRDYMDALVDKVEKDDIHVGFNDACNAAFLTDEMLDVYEAILAKGVKAVEGDSLRLYRMGVLGMSLRWVRLKNKTMREHKVDAAEANAFMTDWNAYGLRRLDEWVCKETTFRALIDFKWRGVEYYKHWTEEGGDEN